MNNNTLKLMKSKLGITKTSKLFTGKTREFLKNLYSSVEDSYKIRIPKNIKPIHRVDYISRGENYKNIPELVRHHIENTLDDTYEYNFNIGHRNIVANIITPGRGGGGGAPVTEGGTKFTSMIFSQIYRWIYVADKFALNTKCSENLTIYIYLTNMKKTLPKTTATILSGINVNTAFTYACIPSNEIYLFRREEWFKVFIHETFHSLGLDFAYSNKMMDLGKREILHVYPIKSDIILSEAYTEFMAEIIQNMFIAAAVPPSRGGGWEMFEDRMKNEIPFSVFQANKVLDFMGIEYQDLYLRDEESRKQRMKYRENTAVFSYYIIKSIMMININEFIEYCIEREVIDGLQFKKDRVAILNFCDFIKKNHDTERVEEYFAIADEALERAKNNRNKEEITNLRMTWGEI